MAVLDRSDTQKIYTSTLLTTLLLASLVFSALLLATASQLSQTTGSATGSIGPVKLFEISKLSLPGGGYSGGFKLLGFGLATYVTVWLLLGLGLAFHRSRYTR